MKLTSYRSTCTARGPRTPQLKFNNLFNEHFSKIFFFKYFVRKNWRGESLYNRWLRLLNMLFPGRIYIARGPWHLGNFCNIFLANISEDQKQSYHLRAGPWHLAIWQIRRWLLHYVHKKLRWGSEIATFRTKVLDFTLVIRLNWLEKIELWRCAGPPGRQYYLLLITVVRVYCCTQRCWKKLKMKNRFFCQIFVIGGISIEGARAPLWATHLATPMILR